MSHLNSIIGVNSIDNDIILKTSTIYNINIVDIQNLTLEDNANVTLDNFYGVKGNIDIKENSTLWINTEGEVELNSLLGNGELVISTDTSLIVKQDITDVIKIKLQGFERDLRNNINKVYVKVDGSINNGASVSLYMDNDYYSIRKEEKQYKLVNNFDKNNINKIEVIQTPDKTSYKEGEKIDLTGIIVILTDTNNIEEWISIEQFAEYNITFEPNANTILKSTDKEVVIKKGQKSTSFPITVTSSVIPQAKTLTLNTNSLNMETGYKKQQLVATITPLEASKEIIWTTNDDTVATVDQLGAVTSKNKVGTATITAKAGSKTATCKVTVNNPPVETKPIGVKYYSHIENYAWESEYKFKNGEISGITGKRLKVEAVKIKLENAPTNAKILYKPHVQDIGWEDWKSNGVQSGTTGQNKKIEVIRIKLENLPAYSVMYRAYVEGLGWQAWVADGIEAGSTGKNLKLEAIEVKIVKK